MIDAKITKKGNCSQITNEHRLKITEDILSLLIKYYINISYII